MDVRDQSKVADQARNRYREVQEELKSSYDKSLDQMKETFAGKTEKQAKNYAAQKTKLEEANQVSNEVYSEKTKSAINRGQEDFKNKLRENTGRFEKERNGAKNELSEKLATLSDSYKKSFDENNRHQEQIKKTMGERYTGANKRYQNDFNTQISDVMEKSNKLNQTNRQDDYNERMEIQQKNSLDLENLRSTSGEQKFKEISRLKNDTENLRTTLSRDNQMLKDRQEERVADLYKMKGKESDDSQKNFKNLQNDLRLKNVNAQEKQSGAHKKESKELEKQFNDDIRNIQSIANQKIKGGTAVESLSDELKQTKNTYENRLQSAREDLVSNNLKSVEKEEMMDSGFREKLKEVKQAHVENVGKKEQVANEVLKKTVHESREKNNMLIDRYKTESRGIKNDSEIQLAKVNEQKKNSMKDQRVEFGRVVNTMNDKNMEIISSLKDDFSKDKTISIERSKKDFNEEKISLKNDFNHQVSLRESLYEQKLSDLEKQTTKIIDNYENRIASISRKVESEVDSIKSAEAESRVKEAQSSKLALENVKNQSSAELVQMRDKYEGKIARDRALTENKTNKIVQKYEDQLSRERIEQQKEMSVRLVEAQSQFERLFKNSEIEKANLRSQYEQRMENMKLASLTQVSSKKE